MSGADEGAAVLPIRDGLELVADVQREALDWFKTVLAEHSGADLTGVCFTIHHADGRCTGFSYSALDKVLPNALIEAQGAVTLTGMARESAKGR